MSHARALLLVAWWLVAGCAGLPSAPRAAPSLRSTGAPAGRAPAISTGGTGVVASRGVAAPAARTELHVRCDDPRSCPSAVGLVVVEGDPGSVPERCTLSLIAPDRALTASHCLAPEQRHAGASCERTWVAFPETADAPAESVGCARVLSVVSAATLDALHQEHAVIQLQRPLARRVFAVDARAPEQNSIVTVVSVTPHAVYGSTHALTTRLCRAIGPEPAQAALGPEAASVGWLESCPIAPGNSGSPVLDTDDHIRAIVHGGTATSSGYAVTSAPGS